MRPDLRCVWRYQYWSTITLKCHTKKMREAQNIAIRLQVCGVNVWQNYMCRNCSSNDCSYEQSLGIIDLDQSSKFGGKKASSTIVAVCANQHLWCTSPTLFLRILLRNLRSRQSFSHHTAVKSLVSCKTITVNDCKLESICFLAHHNPLLDWASVMAADDTASHASGNFWPSSLLAS